MLILGLRRRLPDLWDVATRRATLLKFNHDIFEDRLSEVILVLILAA
jgi:hypothetical protein